MPGSVSINSSFFAGLEPMWVLVQAAKAARTRHRKHAGQQARGVQ